ncbi:hypothetical protein GH714_011534 [Hevea brasiliensis]|uniref:Interferon-related developmental regulator N-terminal domain-containing protein n=1 Tax=Hevea brasiliensis TaxID=3981 RepID=A0A6A6NGK5_HEVBR|nr:hypothetical protein GH714_011534 [Hevea brasiliensis]
MGRRNAQRKNIAMLDSDDDDNSSVSSSSTIKSDRLSVLGTKEVQLDKDSLLEQALDALYEKRGSTREGALASIIDAFNSNMQHQFVEKNFATLLHQCLRLLALTVGCGDNAHEIMEESVIPLSQALKSRSESSKKVVAGKSSAPVITAVVSAWAFLLTTMDERTLDPKDWQESISFFSDLLDKDDRSIRIAAEAGGKGSKKKDLSNQRNLFKDFLKFLEYGYCPETSMKIGGNSLQTSTWSQLIQDNDLLHDIFGFMPEEISSRRRTGLQVPKFSPQQSQDPVSDKQRMLSKARNVGYFAFNIDD